MLDNTRLSSAARGCRVGESLPRTILSVMPTSPEQFGESDLPNSRWFQEQICGDVRGKEAGSAPGVIVPHAMRDQGIRNSIEVSTAKYFCRGSAVRSGQHGGQIFDPRRFFDRVSSRTVFIETPKSYQIVEGTS